MGLFDRERNIRDADFATNGQTFDLHDATYLGVVKSSQFGEQPKAELVAGPDREKFVTYGVKAEQIRRMEPGELPARVKIGKDGQAEPFERG